METFSPLWLLCCFFPISLTTPSSSILWNFFLFLVPKCCVVLQCSILRPLLLLLSTFTGTHGLGTIHISDSQLGVILSPKGHLPTSGNIYFTVITWGRDVAKHLIVHRMAPTTNNYLAPNVRSVKMKTLVSMMMNPKCESLLVEATKSQNDMSVY